MFCPFMSTPQNPVECSKSCKLHVVRGKSQECSIGMNVILQEEILEQLKEIGKNTSRIPNKPY
jgi:hypothetical protein